MSQIAKFGQAIKDIINGVKPQHYSGAYMDELAEGLKRDIGPYAEAWEYGFYGANRMLKKQRQDLAAFGVEFDTWARESDYHGNSMLMRLFRDGSVVLNTTPTRCGICAHPREEKQPCAFCDGDHPVPDFGGPWFGGSEDDPQMLRYSEEADPRCF